MVTERCGKGVRNVKCLCQGSETQVRGGAMVKVTVNHWWENIKLPCVSEWVLQASPEEVAQRRERSPFYAHPCIEK